MESRGKYELLMKSFCFTDKFPKSVGVSPELETGIFGTAVVLVKPSISGRKEASRFPSKEKFGWSQDEL